MSLRERLGITPSVPLERRAKLYQRFGVVENPFPPASQPMGHPHLRTSADDEIEQRLKTFLNDKKSQAIVVEGTQGTGKTNLLEYYKNELTEIFSDDARYYIIRYYPDPDADFRSVVRRIVQDFGPEDLQEIGRRFGSVSKNPVQSEKILSVVRGHETRHAFLALGRAAADENSLVEASALLLEYLLGLRVLKRHTEVLGVRFRLDSTESQTQGLHDLVYFNRELGCLQAIFLLLDEMEKQAGVQPTQVVVRYLSAIRALIDALPNNLFMVLAMTSDARRRYSTMLPALAGRLQVYVSLSPLGSAAEALDLCRFYLAEARQAASAEPESTYTEAGSSSPLRDEEVRGIYATLLGESARLGVEGVTQRAFLDRLHRATEPVIAKL